MPPKRKKRGNPTQHIVEIVVPPLSSFASWKDVVHRSSKRPTPQSSLASLTEGSRQFADSNTSKDCNAAESVPSVLSQECRGRHESGLASIDKSEEIVAGTVKDTPVDVPQPNANDHEEAISTNALTPRAQDEQLSLLQEAQRISRLPKGTRYFSIKGLAVESDGLARILHPSGIVGNQEIFYYCESLNVVGEAATRIMTREAHPRVLAFRGTEAELGWCKDINPQRCRRLIFPEVGAIEPYSDRGFVVIDFQRERLELYSSNPRSTSMSRFIEQRYLYWLQHQWQLHVVKGAIPFDAMAWLPRTYVVSDMISGESATHSGVVYCIAAKCLAQGVQPTKASGLAVSDALISSHRETMAQSIIFARSDV